MTISTIKLDCPTFPKHFIENGGRLPREPEAQALWYYYLTARQNYEESINPIVLVGDADPVYNYKQLYRSVCDWYGVNQERMSWFWDAVDAQCAQLKLPKLPHHLRFKGIIIR